MKTINKKRFVIEMPMTIAKIQSSILSLLPIPPVLTRDQCDATLDTLVNLEGINPSKLKVVLNETVIPQQ